MTKPKTLPDDTHRRAVYISDTDWRYLQERAAAAGGVASASAGLRIIVKEDQKRRKKA
jgi:hypothetical protein